MTTLSILVMALACDSNPGDEAVTDADEVDPIYEASVVSAIVAADLARWDESSAWGDHSAAGYLTAEVDPAFTASVAATLTQQEVDGWNVAYGWGDHALASYLTAELDPEFSASAAAVIAQADLDDWDTAYGWGDHAQAGYLTDTNPVVTGDLTMDGSLRVGNSILNAYAIGLPVGMGYSTDPLHIKLGYEVGVDALMFNLSVKGHLYQDASAFDISVVGYLYGVFGLTGVGVESSKGTVSASVYVAGDGYLVLKLEAPTDWHASDLVIDVVGGGSSYHTGAADLFTVVQAVHASTDL